MHSADRQKCPATFCFFAVLLLFNGSPAQAQYTCTTNAGSITISRYNGPGGDVTIPTTINGLPVTSIGSGAFYESTLTSVTIPGGVPSVGDRAFGQCMTLTNVSLPAGLVSIGSSAFAGTQTICRLMEPGD